jgi:LEA14-like dessication related protein
MKISKKTAIWGGVIALLGVTAVWVNKQVKKMNDFVLTFKKISVNKFNLQELDFNVFYEYKNNADIDINLSSQEYDIYVNGTFITTMTNYAENSLKANSTSSLGFNCKLNLPDLDKKLRLNYFKMVAQPKEVKISVVMKWKVRLGFIKIPISYTWDTDLKEILGWYLPIYRK